MLNITRIITKLSNKRKKKAETLLISLGKLNLQSTIIKPCKKKKWLIITDKHEYRKENNVLPVYLGSMQKILAEIAPELVKVFSNGNLTIVDPGCGSGILGLSFAREKKVKVAYEIDINPRALKMTNLNFLIQGVENKLKLINKSYFEMKKIQELIEKVDIIVSNPPFNPELPGLPWAIHSGGGNVTGTLHFEKQIEQLDELLSGEGTAIFYMLSPIYDENGNYPYLIDIFKKKIKNNKLKNKKIYLIRLQREGYSLSRYEQELKEVHRNKKSYPIAMKLVKKLKAKKFKGFNRYALLIVNKNDSTKSKKVKLFLNLVGHYENGNRKQGKCNYKERNFGRDIILLIPEKQRKEIDITTPFPKKETFKILYSYWSYTK